MSESANKEDEQHPEAGQDMAVTVDIAVPAPARLGEGPVWDMEDARLWWVDIKGGLIHCFDPASGDNGAFDFGEPETEKTAILCGRGNDFIKYEKSAQEHTRDAKSHDF